MKENQPEKMIQKETTYLNRNKIQDKEIEIKNADGKTRSRIGQEHTKKRKLKEIEADKASGKIPNYSDFFENFPRFISLTISNTRLNIYGLWLRTIKYLIILTKYMHL